MVLGIRCSCTCLHPPSQRGWACAGPSFLSSAAASDLHAWQFMLPVGRGGVEDGEQAWLWIPTDFSTIFLLDFPCLSPELSRWCSAARNTRALASGCSHLGCCSPQVFRHMPLLPDGLPSPLQLAFKGLLFMWFPAVIRQNWGGGPESYRGQPSEFAAVSFPPLHFLSILR